MSDPSIENYDIVVVGAGLTGLMAAMELAERSRQTQWSIALIGPTDHQRDGRTTAMMVPTVQRLELYGVWTELVGQTAPLRTMRLVDDTERLIRAPLVDFQADEIGEDAFGYNVPNATLAQSLETKLAACSRLVRINDSVTKIDVQEESVVLLTGGGKKVRATAAIAADGRHSKLRSAAGIDLQTWSYPQTALVTTFRHSLSHQDVSTEFHTPQGPFTIVPLPPRAGTPHRSSLVWVVNPSEVNEKTALDEAALNAAIEKRMQSMLGRVTVETGLQAFPLSGMTAKSFAVKRIALVGEAGHLFPPIGAQGFNLGTRDAVEIAEILAKSPSFSGKNIHHALSIYDRSRRADIVAHTAGIDLLNRSLLSDFLPVQATRAAGIGALAHIGPLRRIAMKSGMGSKRETNPAATAQR